MQLRKDPPAPHRRLEYQRADGTVTDHSDKPTGPTAGSETMDALEFLARVASHIPDKGPALLRLVRLAAAWHAAQGRRQKEIPIVNAVST